jgi:transcriptional regulator with XRE-family HTH domain
MLGVGVMNAAKRPDSADLEVGQRIRMQRLARKMTQSALATELGVTLQQVQKYETGVNRITAGRLNRIADVLEIPIGRLLGCDDEVDGEDEHGLGSKHHPQEYELLSRPGAIRLLRAYEQIADADIRQLIASLVERLAGHRGPP